MYFCSLANISSKIAWLHIKVSKIINDFTQVVEIGIVVKKNIFIVANVFIYYLFLGKILDVHLYKLESRLLKDALY